MTPPEAPTDAGSVPAKSRRRVWIVALPLVLFLALATLFLVRLEGGGDPSQVPSPLVGRAAPEAPFPALEGLTRDGAPVSGFDVASLRGKPALVNVWASWCGPCRAEHPLLMELAKDPRVQVVGLNYKDKPDNARRFLGQYGLPYAAVGADPNGRLAIDWGVYGVPETFVLDRNGVIVHKFIGPLTPEAVEGTLLPLIAKLSAPGA